MASAIFQELQRAAFRLAGTSGQYLARARTASALTVAFKSDGSNFNPVSNVDRETEMRLRAAIAEQFPDHAVIGEELDEPVAEAAEFTWVLDPIDGTTNYLNGVPLFASSIGVLHQGVPVAGAIWCASTHALRPGVYHAHRGGTLCFDGVPLERRTMQSWRGLATEPGRAPRHATWFDTRVLASAALECAFVSAGLLRLSHLARPALWDIAAGVVLGEASGCTVLTQMGGKWQPLQRFDGELRTWRQPVLIGDPDAVDRAANLARSRATR